MGQPRRALDGSCRRMRRLHRHRTATLAPIRQHDDARRRLWHQSPTACHLRHGDLCRRPLPPLPAARTARRSEDRPQTAPTHSTDAQSHRGHTVQARRLARPPTSGVEPRQKGDAGKHQLRERHLPLRRTGLPDARHLLPYRSPRRPLPPYGRRGRADEAAAPQLPHLRETPETHPLPVPPRLDVRRLQQQLALPRLRPPQCRRKPARSDARRKNLLRTGTHAANRVQDAHGMAIS